MTTIAERIAAAKAVESNLYVHLETVERLEEPRTTTGGDPPTSTTTTTTYSKIGIRLISVADSKITDQILYFLARNFGAEDEISLPYA